MKSLGLICLLAILASTLTLAQTNPAPLINEPLVPEAVAPGGKGFKLTVNGTGFVSASVVNWNGSARTTSFDSKSQLRASLLASDIAKPSTALVTVVNPSPGGGTSNVAYFEVTQSTSTIYLGRTDVATGRGPYTAAVGDLNADGNLDLVVADINGSTVSVLLGNGDGTFQPHVDYATGIGPSSVAVGDFNGDGTLDLVVANYDNNGSNPGVSVLLGNGDGTFQPHVDYVTLGNPTWVAVGDFNRDGALDLAEGNCGIGPITTVSVLLGNGDGTFQPHVEYQAGRCPWSVAVGDFNRDGKLDLAAANNSDNTVSILLGNGDGTFQTHVDYVTGGISSVAVGDFNGDGNLDLVAGGDVSVLLGNGDGTFRAAVNYGTGNSAVVGDFNGDGKLDLAVTDASGVGVLLGNGDGTFQTKVDYGLVPNFYSVVPGDFNRDGRLDLAVTGNAPTDAVSILLQSPIALSPPSLNFGVRLLGTRTAQKVVFTNIGNSTLAIQSIDITGTDAGDFKQKDNCGSSLPPGKHCAITVTFKPAKLGPRTAAVTITDDAPGSPQSVPLSGIGATAGPNATLSTKSLTFATQLVATTSPAQPVTLSNYGTESLNIASIVASGDYSETDNCGSSLPPEGSCTINVTFTPTQRGHRSGMVTITDNAPNSPQKVGLTGVGTVVKLVPASLDFGTVTVGQKSSPQNTRLTNIGKPRLHITGITITGTDQGDFSQQNDCPNPGYLGGGKSCTITVTFQPTQVGSRTADVSVSDNGGGSPQQVSLSGTGKSQCGGRCNQGRCQTGCRCVFGVCRAAALPTISGNLDTPWGEQTASELLCASRPVVAFACQE